MLERQVQQSDRVVRLREATQIVGLRRSAVYEMRKAGRFPTGFKIGKARVWWESELLDWLREQERKSQEA